jgi:mannitol/fructose-specific phosphotransferase system IIA component (Ntr-type)
VGEGAQSARDVLGTPRSSPASLAREWGGPPRYSGRVLLTDLLTEDRIKADLTGATRDEVLVELIDLLVERGALPKASLALEKVLEREEKQTTGLGSGIAIPHAVCVDAPDVIAALGLHRAGVDFASVDGEPVRLVILLVVPPNRFQAHIRTLAGIARLLNDASLRRQITEAPDAAAVMDILIEREEAAV